MAISIFLVAFLNLVLGKFLLKQLNSALVNDFFMRDIVKSGKTDFGKLTANTGAPLHLSLRQTQRYHQCHL